MEDITFDEAIDLLEITDISKVKLEDIPKLKRNANSRWHPDKIEHLNDPSLTKEYTEKFQQIEFACKLIADFLSGEYHAGEQFSKNQQYNYESEENIDRNNAEYYQQTIKNLWPSIKQTKYKWSVEEYVISDGRKVKELLDLDFKEDVAVLSIISFFYGIILFGLTAAIAGIFSPVAGTIVGIVFLVQATACILGFLPLSRFWLPSIVSDAMVLFVNFGLGIYNRAHRGAERANNVWLGLLVQIPLLFAKLIKYIILFPLYEITKAIIGDKIIGLVKKNESYYADIAGWYIEELLDKLVNNMTDEEISRLSYLYHEFNDFQKNNSQRWNSNQTENSSQSRTENYNSREESYSTNSNSDFINKDMDNEKTNNKSDQNRFCSGCGYGISILMKFCPNCGAATNNSDSSKSEFNEKKKTKPETSENPIGNFTLHEDDALNNKKRVNRKIAAIYSIILILLSSGYFAYTYISPDTLPIGDSNESLIVTPTIEPSPITVTSPVTIKRPTKTALFFDALHKADIAFKEHKDSLAKELYETSLLYEPNDEYALKQLSIITNRMEKEIYSTVDTKPIEYKTKPIKFLIPDKLTIHFDERNSISWSNLGDGWEYAVTIFEKDAGNKEVYFSNKETNRIDLPIANLLDNRLYILKIESVMDTLLGPANTKPFSLIDNGSKLDPTCR